MSLQVFDTFNVVLILTPKVFHFCTPIEYLDPAEYESQQLKR